MGALDEGVADVEINIPLHDKPDWLSHLSFSRVAGEIVITVVKRSGYPYGTAHFSPERFSDIADVLTSAPDQPNKG